MERFPEIDVSVDQKTAQFPKYLTDMRIERRKDVGFQVELDEEDEKTDEFRLSSFVLEKEASVGFPYCNVLHLMADGRKVLSRPLDNLLGFKGFGNDHIYHGCVEGAFLNQRANHQRTYFNFDEATAERITKACVEQLRSSTLRQECEKHDERRSLKFDAFLPRESFIQDGLETRIVRRFAKKRDHRCRICKSPCSKPHPQTGRAS